MGKHLETRNNFFVCLFVFPQRNIISRMNSPKFRQGGAGNGWNGKGVGGGGGYDENEKTETRLIFSDKLKKGGIASLCSQSDIGFLCYVINKTKSRSSERDREPVLYTHGARVIDGDPATLVTPSPSSLGPPPPVLSYYRQSSGKQYNVTLAVCTHRGPDTNCLRPLLGLPQTLQREKEWGDKEQERDGGRSRCRK